MKTIFEIGDLVEIKKPPGDFVPDVKYPEAGSLGFIEQTSFAANCLKRNWYFVRMSNGASEVLKDDWIMKVEGKKNV